MKTNYKNLIICPVTLFSLVLYCGIYSFSGSTLPGHIKTVNIPLFENRTAEFGIDQQLTDAIIYAISQDNTLKIADNQSSDSIVQGLILKVEDSAGQYNQSEVASDFRITVQIQVSYEDLTKRKTLWKETWSQWGTYKNDRAEGIREALEKLSQDILNRTVSGW